MEGNGQFVVRPSSNKMPMRLQLDQMDGGDVAVVASLGDGTVQTLCVFRAGALVMSDLSDALAKKMGIELDEFGYIKAARPEGKNNNV